MKLHAGSLYKNYLVLYGEADDSGRRIIQVDNIGLQWDIYCNDVEFEALDFNKASVTFQGKTYEFPFLLSKNPFQTLKFSI